MTTTTKTQSTKTTALMPELSRTAMGLMTHREKLAYADLRAAGRTVEEVARAFGVSKWAIYKRARRAARKLAASGVPLPDRRPVARRRTRAMSQYEARGSGSALASAML